MFARVIQKIWYQFVLTSAAIFCKVFFRCRFYGRENVPKTEAFLLICNHQSFIDPVLLAVAAKRHLHFLARDTLFKNKFFAWLISSVNAMPVRRGEADMGAMKMIISKLKEGKPVLLFPEGTRSLDGKISAFKPGFGLLCKRGKAGILPAVIDGAFEAWPKNKKFFKFAGRIEVSFGKYTAAEEVRNTDSRELADKLTDVLRQMQKVSRQRQGKEVFEY